MSSLSCGEVDFADSGEQVAGISANLLEHSAQQIKRYMGLNYFGARRLDLARLLNLAAMEYVPTDPQRWLNQLAKEEWALSLQRQLIRQLTVGETYFFRDPDFFQGLVVRLNALIIQARLGEKRQTRVWSAGCCTGEEAYSVLFCLQQLLATEASNWQLVVYGTDLNPEFIERAKFAEYGHYALRHVSKEMLLKYFDANGKRQRIKPNVREKVSFFELNLAQLQYPNLTKDIGNFDLILCRNVLMYFSQEMATSVIQQLRKCLAKDGVLVLSAVEASLAIAAGIRGDWLSGAYFITESDKAPELLSSVPEPAISLATYHPKYVPARIEPKQTPSLLKERESDTKPESISHTAASAFKLQWQKAQTEFEQARYKSAIALWQAMLLSSDLSKTQQFEACVAIARAQANLNELDEATESIERCLRMLPLNPVSYWLKALIEQQTGRIENAIIALRQCLYLSPNFIMANVLLGQLLLRTSQHQQGLSLIRHSIQLLQNWPVESSVPESDQSNPSQIIRLCEHLIGENNHES